ncbi:MAG: glutamine-hydrolyzing carbamoyl-phosphate synthase small subunit [Spirochaetaceae bacterium]
MQAALLFLADGTMFPGYAFGAPPLTLEDLRPGEARAKGAGEVVFNTAMSGYHEVLTDPSYTGQIVTMTYPHVGNYGTDQQWSETGPEPGTDRPGVKVAGFALRSLYDGPVGPGRRSLPQFLAEHGTPGITDVDTRGLTLHLRDEGSSNGVIVAAPAGFERARAEHTIPEEFRRKVLAYLEAFPAMEGRNLVGEVGSPTPEIVNPEGSPHVALLDCGVKGNIVRELVSRGARVSIWPSTADPKEVLDSGAQAVVLSNGPGDPAVLGPQIDSAKRLMAERPTLGVCLGHQLIAEAAGAKTYKMKFGHHGVNHPVRDEETGRVFVTSQNHGFAVEEETLPGNVSVWLRNANDGSVEGLKLTDIPVMSAQFHPEAAPGPQDARWIFDEFLKLLRSKQASGTTR